MSCARKVLLSNVVLFLMAVSMFTACTEPKVQGGRIVLRNDILDKQYNSFRIDKVVTAKGLKGFSRTLKPSQEIALPFKRVILFRLTRKYKDHEKIYVVRCPSDMNTELRIKLIDVHTNRIRGGCALIKKGRREQSGYLKWEASAKRQRKH